LLDAYREVVKKLIDDTLNWAYDHNESCNIVIPNNVIDICKDISTINGKEALYGTVKLWKHMYSDPSILPRPVITRIIPKSHAQWNATKGGSDTITKLVDDCHVKPPKFYTNFEVVASMRSYSNLCATILRLFQVISAKPDLSQAYPSLQHYRNAASHRCTYKKMLRMIYSSFKEKVRQPFRAIENMATQNRRRATNRVRFNNTIPEQMNFAPSKTFQTPTKARKRIIDKGMSTQHVLNQSKVCSGYPFEVVDQGTKTKDQRRSCYICGTKTKWQCIKCRFFFCLEYKHSSKRKEHLYYTKEKVQNNSNHEVTKIYGKTCFHIHHENAITHALTCQNVLETDMN